MAGMELFIFQHEAYDKLYNCSAYDIGSVPLGQRVHHLHGWLMIAMCSFFVVVYIPTLAVIISKYAHKTAYQLMLSIGICDVMMLAVVIIPYGVQQINGDVFCSYPTPLYIIGCLSMGLWVTSTETGVILALYRCLELWKHSYADALFKDHRTLIWITLSWLHCLAIFLFTMPIVYIPMLGTMLLNPHHGYIDDPEGKFYNNHHRIYNRVILAITVALYIMFVYVIVSQRKKLGSGAGPSRNLIAAQRRSLIQALVICSSGAVSDAYWAIVLLGPSPPQIAIFIGMYTWICCHGMPGLVYLCMNKSVRSSISAAILPRAKRIAIFGATGQVITGNVTTGNLSSSKDTRKYEQEVDVA
ncbi:serpentine type 7TM GPCR chemoreceptor srt domain-containing protein [Ditylenchus destructor]|uniref:Serpentine type 7TM GPCR chemoreceptor srt domain-containing protein n=1 Tax=Ditylenchus destructor TaxID=166010 RepID=A0AAD4QZN6_9BILA|nr:serpentine type 7TM GPCR chemoreceptor srt domain-containing protein [Ditylenchus destructor]